jgi:hypothetical protein
MRNTKPALRHLWLSLFLLLVAGGVILYAWYPAPFLHFAGTEKFSLLLLLAALLMGAPLTWLVYREGKKYLALDITIIILIQLAAFGWAMMMLYRDRPYFMVFTVDRFDILAQPEIDPAAIPDSKFLNKPFRGPILLYANMPPPGPVYQRLLREIVMEGKPDLQYRPAFWSLYAKRQQSVTAKEKSLAVLRRSRPGAAKRIDRFVHGHGGDINTLGFVPAHGQGADFTVVLDRESGAVIGMLNVDPWVD